MLPCHAQHKVYEKECIAHSPSFMCRKLANIIITLNDNLIA